MRATVTEIKANGLTLRLDDDVQGKEVWLPKEEWSISPKDWENDWELASLAIDIGSELDVIPLPRSIEGRPVVSRKGFTFAAVDDGWMRCVREMRVEDVGRTLIRGTIGENVPAVVKRDSYLDWIDSKELSQELSDHSVLGKGDFIRG